MKLSGTFNVNKFRSIGMLGVVTAGMVAMSATTASALTIPLVNAGFETPDGASNDIIGWDEVDFAGQGYRSGTFTYPVPFASFSGPNPEGTRIGYLDATTTISQNSQHALVAGETYTLSVWLGNRSEAPQRPTDVRIYADNGLGGLGDELANVSVGEEGVPNGTWQQLSVMFDTTLPGNASLVTANLGRDLHVFIGHSLDETGGGEVDVDGVVFSYTPVPEPAALSILGLGALTVLRRRR